MNEQLLDLIRCPISLESLTFADDSLLDRVNGAITKGGVRNSSGALQQETLEAALVNTSGRWLFSIRNKIPAMVSDEAIDLRSLDEATKEASEENA